MNAPVPDGTAPMTDIHDIKPALAFGAQWPWWAWLLIVLALAALAALIWWLRSRDRKDNEMAVSEPALPPEVEAFQQLDRLAARERVDPKQFYFSLSAILRRYVERRYEFPAAEMTTEELLPHIQRLGLTDAQAGGVKHFCRSSDPIKFADAASSQADMSKDLAFARQFVEQTTATAMAAEDQDSNDPPETAMKTVSPNQLPHLKGSA